MASILDIDDSYRSFLVEAKDTYKRGLLEDVIPFWLKHCIDREHGGYLFCLGKKGEVIDTTKPMWIHGRFVWMLSTLYSSFPVEER